MNSIDSRYFDDFKLGEKFVTAERKITEKDIAEFTRLTGDTNPIHLDPAYAKTTPYKSRVAHGLLGLSITSGLAARLGFAQKTTLAFRSLTWKFRKPVYIDDILKSTFQVIKKRALAGNQGGLITFKVEVLNQNRQLVQSGKWSLIIKKRQQKTRDSIGESES